MTFEDEIKKLEEATQQIEIWTEKRNEALTNAIGHIKINGLE